MRILMTNRDMEYRGGTQSWLRTLYAELSKKHQVDVYVHTGSLPEEFTPFDSEAQYDIALINHVPCFRDLARARIRTRVFTSHGTKPAEEWAPPGADHYVAVSELVAAHVPYPCSIVRNPIATDRFVSNNEPALPPRRVLFLSNRQGQALPLLEKACQIAGMDLTTVGKEKGVTDALPLIRQTDIVVSLGRGALEAMSCGRHTIIFDHYGYAGVVAPETVLNLRKENFSGALTGMWPSPETLAKILTGCGGPSMREYVVAEHSAGAVAQAYLALAEQHRGRTQRLVAAVVRSAGAHATSTRYTNVVMHSRNKNFTKIPAAIFGPPRPPDPHKEKFADLMAGISST